MPATPATIGTPVRVDDPIDKTTFLVALKDAWWTDYEPSADKNKKTFFVVFYYKNLGPREGSCVLHNVEVKTSKGHVFSGFNFRPASYTRDVGGWLSSASREIEGTGESGFAFHIPVNEVLEEVVFGNSKKYSFELPKRSFEFRRYTGVFGFLPHPPEKALPGLINALQPKGQDVTTDQIARAEAMREIGNLGAAAKDAVPALTNVLLHANAMDVRALAATTLGEIGPAAKEAIPALKNPMQASRPQLGAAFQRDLDSACAKAIEKISGRMP